MDKILLIGGSNDGRLIEGHYNDRNIIEMPVIEHHPNTIRDVSPHETSEIKREQYKVTVIEVRNERLHRTKKIAIHSSISPSTIDNLLKAILI